MPEATNDRAQNPEARRGVMTPEHGITITIRSAECSCALVRQDTPDEARILDRDCVQHCEGGGQAVRASCLCGWQSPTVPSRTRAVAEGQAHTAAVCSGPNSEGASRSATPYLDRVAQAVAERICTRGVVLTVDELATIAMALDCSASELLPPVHLMSDEQTKPLAVWQTEPCPPWCVIEHPDDDHPDDRDHGGEIRFVGLRSYPAVNWGADNWELPRWGTYLRAPAAGGEPVVYTFSDEIASGSLLAVELHLDEAKQLVSTLLATIAEAGDPAEVTR